MGRLKRIYIDESLVNILEQERKNIAKEIKKKYHLDSVIINEGFTSQALAHKIKKIDYKFKIKKRSFNVGFVEFL